MSKFKKILKTIMAGYVIVGGIILVQVTTQKITDTTISMAKKILEA